MSKKPLVSVVVPVWNRETYLAEMIRSIQKQTYGNFELILVDDGSTDSVKYLYDYYTKQDDRIRVIYKKHGGIAKARNLGIKKSKGDYIAVMDSDDVMFPTRLSEEVKVLEKYDFCSSYYLMADKKLTPGLLSEAKVPDQMTLESIRANLTPPHFMIMAHRRCFEENPYREEFTCNDDSALVFDWYKAGYTNKIIKHPLGVQRGHIGNISKSTDGKLEHFLEILNKEYDKWEKSQK